MNINTQLNRRLHMLLAQNRMMGQKAQLIEGATNGRSTSSKDLTVDEARSLISYLRTLPNAQQERAEKMRRKIISMAHEMGWHTLVAGRWIADMARLNDWMVKSSYLHKPINRYSYNELPKLVTQFEAVYKSFLNKV